MMEYIYPAFERGRIMKKEYYGHSGIILIRHCNYNMRIIRTVSFQAVEYG